jgi:ComF family protein
MCQVLPFLMFNTIFNQLYSYASTIITPPFCHGCGLFLSQETIFCNDCWKQVSPVAPTVVPITLQKSVTVYALGAYSFPLKKLILAKNHQSIATSALIGHALWQKTLLPSLSFDYIVPIPLHWTRRCWRGFNQSEEIARIISKQSQKKIVSALKRHKKTVFQAECKKDERIKNLEGAFSLIVDKKFINDKTILLVDDLLTTGTTLAQAAQLLYKAGAKNVIAIVGAKAI